MITIPGRIPIHIHPLFWVMAVLIGGDATGFHPVGTFSWVVVIFFSVLIHEYGHALTAFAFHREVHIELIGMGGVAVHQGKKLHLWQEFLIVLNGPLAGFGLYLIAEYLSIKMSGPRANFWHYLVNIMADVNWYWTLFNLLPVPPLDGGRLLSIVMELLFGARGVRAVLLFGIVLGVLLSINFFIIDRIYMGVLFLLTVFENYQVWSSPSSQITSKNPNDKLEQLFEEANEHAQRGERTEAKRLLAEVRNRSESGKLFVAATVLLAELLAHEGRSKEAYEYLQPIKKKLSSKEFRFLHRLAYQNGSWREVTELGNKTYQQLPSYDTAYINALGHAILREPHAAVGWLQRSIRDGLPDSETILKQKEFDPIRSAPEFQKLYQRQRLKLEYKSSRS